MPTPSMYIGRIVSPGSSTSSFQSFMIAPPKLWGDLRVEDFPYKRYASGKGNDSLN
jgi:hypothetical protein